MAIVLSTKPVSRTMGAEAKVSTDETPILRMLRAWEDLNSKAEAYVIPDSLSLDEVEALVDRLFYDQIDKIEKELMALPCTCAADFAAKLIVDTSRGVRISDWKTGTLWAEARALTKSSA